MGKQQRKDEGEELGRAPDSLQGEKSNLGSQEDPGFGGHRLGEGESHTPSC